MGKAKGMLCVAAVVLAAGLTAWAQEAGKRPSETVRFKKGEHPRVWVTAADLPALRARCAAGGTHEREFKRLKGLVDAEMAQGEPGGQRWEESGWRVDPVPVALVYLVTGERKYAERAKKMLLVCPRGNPITVSSAAALDWIMAKSDLDKEPGVPMTPAELTAVVKALAETGGRWELKVEEVPGPDGLPV